MPFTVEVQLRLVAYSLTAPASTVTVYIIPGNIGDFGVITTVPPLTMVTFGPGMMMEGSIWSKVVSLETRDNVMVAEGSVPSIICSEKRIATTEAGSTSTDPSVGLIEATYGGFMSNTLLGRV